jgi:predicted kinase
MKALRASLINLEQLDLDELVNRWPKALRELAAMRDFEWGSRNLLQHTQHALDWLAENAPELEAAGRGPVSPWWERAAALRLAVIFRHSALPHASCSNTTEEDITVSEALASALICRQALRRAKVPFPTRAHAEALVRHSRQARELICSEAPAETFMRLACKVDCQSLYSMSRAELEALGSDAEQRALDEIEAFREKCTSLSIFEGPPEPPVELDRIAAAGFADTQEQHRMANALRYFRVCQGIRDAQHLLDRVSRESAMHRGRLNLLVGIAGSGKSQWAKKNLGQTTIVSSDEVRAEITGDPEDQSRNAKVFKICTERIYKTLREGGTATLDATNYSEKLRNRPVATARLAGAEICTYFFDISLSEALKRNRSREREVPAAAIRKQWRRLTPPALYEADRHFLVDAQGEAEQYWPVRNAAA